MGVVQHDDLNISDSWTDYATGSYIEITGPKDRENIESLVVPASIDSNQVTLIGEDATGLPANYKELAAA